MHMLTNVNSYFIFRIAWCLNVISWKHSFNRLNEEYEIARKKQQALDSLYQKGRISQSTHDSFNTEIAAAIAEIERQQQDLLQKMNAKTSELQDQIKTLEMLFANYEIQYVAGEVDENTYNLEINLLSSGLETAKHELQTINDAVSQLCSPAISAPTPIAEPVVEAPTVEATPAPMQETAEAAVADCPVDHAPAEVIAAPEPIIQEQISVPIAETAPAIEEPVAIAEAPVMEAAPEAPIAEPVAVAEAPVEQAPTIVEQPIIEQPVIEQPVAEVATVEAPIVEQAVVEAPVIEAPIDQPTVVVEEATVVETPVAQEVAAAEPVAVIEEAKTEKVSLDEFDVAAPDVVQKELLQAVEEIAENPFPGAPIVAREETADTTEASVETQPVPIHSAKETSHEAYTDNKE
jgi:hypothetical protein